MTTQEIPQEQWRGYFDQLSEQYQGWGVSIEVLGRELGDQPAVEGLPLQGVHFETQGSEAGNILVAAGNTAAFLAHHIDHPSHVRVADVKPGEETDLQIESQDGTTTLIHVRRRPELPPGRRAN